MRCGKVTTGLKSDSSSCDPASNRSRALRQLQFCSQQIWTFSLPKVLWIRARILFLEFLATLRLVVTLILSLILKNPLKIFSYVSFPPSPVRSDIEFCLCEPRLVSFGTVPIYTDAFNFESGVGGGGVDSRIFKVYRPLPKMCQFFYGSIDGHIFHSHSRCWV